MNNKEALNEHLDYIRRIDISNQEHEAAVSLYKIKLLTALQNQDHSTETLEKLDKIKEFIKEKVEILYYKNK